MYLCLKNKWVAKRGRDFIYFFLICALIFFLCFFTSLSNRTQMCYFWLLHQFLQEHHSGLKYCIKVHTWGLQLKHSYSLTDDLSALLESSSNIWNTIPWTKLPGVRSVMNLFSLYKIMILNRKRLQLFIIFFNSFPKL